MDGRARTAPPKRSLAGDISAAAKKDIAEQYETGEGTGQEAPHAGAAEDGGGGGGWRGRLGRGPFEGRATEGRGGGAAEAVGASEAQGGHSGGEGRGRDATP